MKLPVITSAVASPSSRRDSHRTEADRSTLSYVSPLAVAKAVVVGLLAMSSPAAALARQPDTLGALRLPRRGLQGTVKLNCNDGSGSTSYTTAGSGTTTYSVPCDNGKPRRGGSTPAQTPAPTRATTVGYGRLL